MYLKNGKLDFQEPKLRPENHPLLAESKVKEEKSKAKYLFTYFSLHKELCIFETFDKK